MSLRPAWCTYEVPEQSRLHILRPCLKRDLRKIKKRGGGSGREERKGKEGEGMEEQRGWTTSRIIHLFQDALRE